MEATTSSPSPAIPTQSKSRAAAAGWICLALGMVLMFVSLALFFIYGPLFFAAFVLSIVAMAQRRIAAGVVLLVVTLSVPTVMWVGLVVFKVGSSVSESRQEKKAALSAIVFEDVEGYVDGDYMYLKGKVRNSGPAEVDFVRVEVEWLDATGTVLDTDSTFAVSGQGLAPGGAKSFQIMTPADHRMKRFRYHVKED